MSKMRYIPDGEICQDPRWHYWTFPEFYIDAATGQRIARAELLEQLQSEVQAAYRAADADQDAKRYEVYFDDRHGRFYRRLTRRLIEALRVYEEVASGFCRVVYL